MSNTKYELSLFIFRRDLRLEDNNGLIAALKSSVQVIPCFIFDPRQLSDNPYLGKNALQFMLSSLTELDNELRSQGSHLYCFAGRAEEVINKLLSELKISAVYLNRDYTKFSRERDAAIAETCQSKNVHFLTYSDYLLTEPEDVYTGKRTPYTVYTHFLKKASTIPVPQPQTNNYRNYYTVEVQHEARNPLHEILPIADKNEKIYLDGGRQNALEVISTIEQFTGYSQTRDFPAMDSTTGLSPHLKFGTISIRELYHCISAKLNKSHPLVRQLYWRDFFCHIAWHFPHIFGQSFNKKYDHLVWENDDTKFAAWCNGTTGYPIVDAGMRQLSTTGFMHNRVRMITASFLVKDLHIDWRWGEQYFAQKLIDYDPAVNNGNWQWAASTGCDAQPYFRIFNPWIQGKKFDPECTYIKKWVSELRQYSTKEIQNLEKGGTLLGYPEPIVSHTQAKIYAEQMFRDCDSPGCYMQFPG
ncbi:MAG: deoxyribodipyrimidine photo-lyase [bacterium]|nr:deoxyribodipyrimidine photo-lyase [bacterium]